MIPRYTPPEIAAIFSEESKLRRWLEVEVLAAEGWVAEGRVPADAIPALRAATVDPDRVAELEAEQGHDLAAFVSAVQERLGDEGRFIHLGLTSSDIVDTALATQLRDAWRIIDDDCAALEEALARQAERHRLTLMMGRTHGVHAEPLTLGVKLANLYDEVRRSRGRLAAAAREVSVGNISGAVGTHSSIPASVEEHVCRGLGLEVAAVTTQVVARDRHASLVSAMALLGAVLERIALTVRLLQITEVGEVEEPFSSRQKGSSAMPHKRNPILCERICGMARILRGNALAAMEDVALWHERDISHSSVERMILPDSCALLAYMLRLSTRVVRGIRVNAQTMADHVELFGGIVFSQRLLTALITQAGWSREQSYRTVQALAARARDGGGSFRELVAADGAVRGVLDEASIAEVFDAGAYLRGIEITYTRLGLSTESQEVAITDGEGPAALAVEAGLGGGTL